MTIVTFFKQKTSQNVKKAVLAGFVMEGHSGYAPEGEDIVCAALSAVCSVVEATINDVAMAKADILVEEGYLSLRLPKTLEETQQIACQAVLTGMFLYLSHLSKDYSDNLQIAEEII